MPFVTVNLDWEPGLLEPRSRTGVALWVAGTVFGAERGAGDTAGIDIELVIIL